MLLFANDFTSKVLFSNMSTVIFFYLVLKIHGSTEMIVPAGRFPTEQECRAIGEETIKSIESTAQQAGVSDLRVTFSCAPKEEGMR